MHVYGSSQMIWKIIDHNRKKITRIPPGVTLSIGNVPRADIVILEDKNFPYLAQMILDDFFAFFISPDIKSVFYKEKTFVFEKEKITFELEDESIKSAFNKEEYIDFYKDTVSVEDIVYFNKQSTYFEDIETVRREIINHYSLFSQGENISEDILIKIILNVVFGRFLEGDESFFEKENRRKLKHYIWNILNEMRGHGVLTKLLLNDSITEIMVNGSQSIFIECQGKLEKSLIFFKDDARLQSCIEKICSSVGRRIDESMPYCDARLGDGSRIHAIIPPLALNGPCLTIRKFSKTKITPHLLVEYGSMPHHVMEFLRTIVCEKRNILISGGTGSGKTTLLNCLSSFIPQNERIITIEDSQELQLQQEHVVKLESRNANAEQKGCVSIRDLVRNALRMRPDRIVVGECRGAEALDMLQAMNTGHDGSMTTVHANHPQDALRRLETLVLFAEVELPSRAIREQISAGIHYVVQQSRLSCGKRAVTSIYRVLSLCPNTTLFQTEMVYERSHGD